jgi:amino acid permease
VIFTTPLILYSARLSLNDVIFGNEFTVARFRIIGLCVMLACILLAVTVESVEDVFGLVGGLTCNMIVYILPALYYIRMCRGESRVKTVIAWIMVPVGIILIGFCLYTEVNSIMNE